MTHASPTHTVSDPAADLAADLAVDPAPHDPRREPPGPPARARVVVASHVRLYRAGVAQSLVRHPAIVVAATAASADALGAALGAGPVDAVLVDMAMPDGVAVVRAARAAATPVPAVGFAVSDGPGELAAFADAGLAGYVPREGSVDDLAAALDAALRGQVRWPARGAARGAGVAAGAAADRRAPSAPLTPREREIVALIDHGLSNKEIARRLRIEAATVKNHVHNVLEKLRVHRRGEAAAVMRGARAAGGA